MNGRQAHRPPSDAERLGAIRIRREHAPRLQMGCAGGLFRSRSKLNAAGRWLRLHAEFEDWIRG